MRVWIPLVQIALAIGFALLIGYLALGSVERALAERERFALQDIARLQAEGMTRVFDLRRSQAIATGADKRMEGIFFELMAAHIADARAGGDRHRAAASARLADEIESRVASMGLADLWIATPDGVVLHAARQADLAGRPVAELWPSLPVPLTTPVDAAGRLAEGREMRFAVPVAGADDRHGGIIVIELPARSAEAVSATGQVRFALSGRALPPAEGTVQAVLPVRFGDNVLQLTASASEAVLMRPVGALREDLYQRTAAFLVFVVALCMGISQLVTRRTGRLIQAADSMVRGRLTELDLPLRARDEVGQLARALERLARELNAGRAATDAALFRAAALDAGSAAILIADSRGTVTYLSPAARRLLADLPLDGATPREGETLARCGLGHILEAGGRGADPREGADAPGRRRDLVSGETRIAVSASPIIDGEGADRGVVAELSDVTRMRRDDAMLGAIDAAMLIAEFDPENRVVTANARFGEIFGEDGPPGSFDDAVAEYLAAAASEGSAFARLSVSDAGGRPRRLVGSFAAMRGSDGRAFRVLALLADVTEQALAVEALRDALAALAEGDLTTSLPPMPGGERNADLREDYENALAALREALGVVRTKSEDIRAEVDTIAQGGAALAGRTSRQTAELEATSAGLERVALALRQASALAERTERIVGLAREGTERSRDVVARTAAAMQQISRSSERITSVLGVLEEIALQTDMLALNAGIAAARAGPAGRGFATVAEEVRALARRAAAASGEIAVLMSESGGHVSGGVEAVEETGMALGEVTGQVETATTALADFARTVREQSVTVDELSHALTALDRSTRSTTGRLEDGVAASRVLASEAASLLAEVGRFSIGAAARSRRRAT